MYRVFHMNEIDFVIAKTMEEAIAYFYEITTHEHERDKENDYAEWKEEMLEDPRLFTEEEMKDSKVCLKEPVGEITEDDMVPIQSFIDRVESGEEKEFKLPMHFSSEY